ncbi:nucleoside-diphosphate sugar epimerase/dehydratase [Sinorhizobium sp. NFACC03]|uniref:polysaccharide biosynthesis protein n=1 Tax=Sinorhizobium sp. NFACC03 TaxID=1566295 RepID=UPI000B804836|nr:nucleoside-diphosphate sugar epimerase/dehydratase [Sinorhizobium sp. NFACC03]
MAQDAGIAIAHIAIRRLRSAFRSVRKNGALYVADLASAGVALLVALILRYGPGGLSDRPEAVEVLAWSSIQYLAVCGVMFPLSGLYSRNWKYGSVGDLLIIVRAVILTSLVLVTLLFFSTRLTDMPRTVVPLQSLLLISFLAASRLSFRADEFLPPKSKRPVQAESEGHRHRVPLLLVGAGNAADLYLRALCRDPDAPYLPVACLDSSEAQVGSTLRGVPIVGTLNDLEQIVADLRSIGKQPCHIVYTEPLSSFDEAASGELLRAADRLGIAVSRLSSATEFKKTNNENPYELRSIEMTDLLERPQATLDRDAIRELITGRHVLVTGAGGSIGSELTRQIAACDPAEVVLVDNTEFNLYSIDLCLNEEFPSVRHSSYLCSVRRSQRVNEIFERHLPELVFHAAALKHVPMVQINPCEGVLTNVIGTMNVANAAKRFGALAMVQVSTDKVVNSASIMGMTKRLAELYCQALDLDGLESGRGPRFMTVRFGNVLGSSGSLIPLFKRQLAKGGPLTVTDPAMTRFFMTIREAVELTLQASAYGFQKQIGQGEIFVLDMGEPVKVIDIARRMIRLAGFVPDKDIHIEIVGCRPGEKLFEELFDETDKRIPSAIPGVLGAVPHAVPSTVLKSAFQRMQRHAERCDERGVLTGIAELLPNAEIPRDVKGGGVRPRSNVIALGKKAVRRTQSSSKARH